MSFRKLKHKGRARAQLIWDDMEYGDQMRHFISHLELGQPYENEVKRRDVE